jgi:hypothetical protein
MESMNHERWTDRLSDYADDELRIEDREAVERHLAGCEECRQLLDEIRAVSSRAASLSDVPPERDLWPGVAAGIAAADRRATNVVHLRPPRRFSFTMPQLVAASLALMLLSGGMVWMAQLGGDRTDFPKIDAADRTMTPANPATAPVPLPATFAEAHYDEAIADLQQTLEAGRANLDPETVKILERNLAAIDRAIAQCRQALIDDPANAAYLSQHLVSAKKRKLALLRRATAMADGSS